MEPGIAVDLSSTADTPASNARGLHIKCSVLFERYAVTDRIIDIRTPLFPMSL